jgi:hypothetical protein
MMMVEMSRGDKGSAHYLMPYVGDATAWAIVLVLQAGHDVRISGKPDPNYQGPMGRVAVKPE